MAPKSASKYHALKWLLSLTENNFQTKFAVEYNEQEVQEMIIVKKARKALEAVKQAAKHVKELAEQALEPMIKPVYGFFSRFKSAFGPVSNEINNNMALSL